MPWRDRNQQHMQLLESKDKERTRLKKSYRLGIPNELVNKINQKINEKRGVNVN